MTDLAIAPDSTFDGHPGLLDLFGRALRDLRISVTDRCNFRCTYCMPAEVFGRDYQFLPKAEVLTYEEITRLAAAFSLDMIGRPAGDSVVVDGMEDIDLPTPPVWLAAAHSELRLIVVDGGSATAGGSDHYAFVQQAVPSLHFHNGAHDATGVESGVAMDPDLEARILRLVFYIGQDVANAKRPPEWNTEGRRRYLEMFDH